MTWIRIGEWRYSFTHSLTSARDRGEWSASRPGRFTRRERPPVVELYFELSVGSHMYVEVCFLKQFIQIILWLACEVQNIVVLRWIIDPQVTTPARWRTSTTPPKFDSVTVSFLCKSVRTNWLWKEDCKLQYVCPSLRKEITELAWVNESTQRKV
jgi:hypothetical protein